MAEGTLSNNNSKIINNEHHLEIFSLIWLHANNNFEDYQNTKEQLRAVINHFQQFDDAIECQKCIENQSDLERILLIVNDKFGEQVVASVHKLRQVSSIYVYCNNKKENERWAYKFAKVKAVVDDMSKLVDRIKADYKIRMKELEPLSISLLKTGKSTSEINGQFVFSQLLVDCLLRLKSDKMEADELISCFKKEYEGNAHQLALLQEFQEEYSHNKALWWYTRDSFFYRTLNAALRKQDIHRILLYRSFISDIHRQLQYHQSKVPVRVYRSQLMSTDELSDLRKNIGEFVSINSFFSTSDQRPIALFYMGDTDQLTELERVLFEIDANPAVGTIKPFADISTYSCFSVEAEVLFMIGSIFRLNNVVQGDDYVWTLQMTLCSDDEHDLKQVLSDMKNQYGIGETNFHTLGKLLWNMGKRDLSEKYYTRLINELPPNDPFLRILYQELSLIASQNGEYNKSVQLHKKSLEIQTSITLSSASMQVFQSDSPLDTGSLNILKLIYQTEITIKQTIDRVKANENQCKRLGERINTITLVLKDISNAKLQISELRKFLMDFCICIEQCLAFITKFQSEESWFFTVFNKQNSKEQFEKLNAQLLQCAIDLKLNINIKQTFDHKQDEFDQMNDLDAIAQKRDNIALMMMQQEQEQLHHLQVIEQNANQRYISYKHHLEKCITQIHNSVKVKKTADEQHDFLQIPYYDLIQEENIGQGGFANVYRGRWISQDREVAIKVIRINYLGERVKEDFIEEISTMSQIRHKHILNMFGACIEPQNYAIVVEYMSLGSLYDVLKQKTIQLKWPNQLSIACQMTEGINYLHTLPKPVIHRDIKSHNVLLTETMQGLLVKIGDFGLAKIRRETSKQSTNGPAVGTLAWKAPELLRMGRHNEASDVYALAIVLWELATGYEPYGDADDTTISVFVRNGDRLDIPTSVPERFANLITLAWAQEPKQRLTCKQILNTLKEWRSELDTSDEEEEEVEDLPKPKQLLNAELENKPPNSVRGEPSETNPTQPPEDPHSPFVNVDIKTVDQRMRMINMADEPEKMLMPIQGYQNCPLLSLEESVVPLRIILPNIQTYVYVCKIRCNRLSSDALTHDESASIMLYSMEWEPADQCLYKVLNDTLRGEDRTELQPWFAYLKLFLTALSKLSSVRDKIYRGVKLDFNEKFSRERLITWWGFTSCTTSIKTLENERFLGKTGTRTLFVIEAHSAKQIHRYSYYPNEDEILLLPARQFRVISCLDVGNGLTVVQLNEIDPKFPLLEPVTGTVFGSRDSDSGGQRPRTNYREPRDIADKHIMVLYTLHNRTLVEEVINQLGSEGYSIWTADNNILESVSEDTANAIENAWVVICFLSDKYQLSDECREQLRHSIRRKKTIIPILTMIEWSPSGWLEYSIGDIKCLQWQGVQPDNVRTKMPELFLRLRAIATGIMPSQNEIREAREASTGSAVEWTPTYMDSQR